MLEVCVCAHGVRVVVGVHVVCDLSVCVCVVHGHHSLAVCVRVYEELCCVVGVCLPCISPHTRKGTGFVLKERREPHELIV